MLLVLAPLTARRALGALALFAGSLVLLAPAADCRRGAGCHRSAAMNTECSLTVVEQCCMGQPNNNPTAQIVNVGTCLATYLQHAQHGIKTLPEQCCRLGSFDCKRRAVPMSSLMRMGGNTPVWIRNSRTGKRVALDTPTYRCSDELIEKCCNKFETITEVAARSNFVGSIVGCMVGIIESLTTVFGFKIPEECCAIPLIGFLCGKFGGESDT